MFKELKYLFFVLFIFFFLFFTLRYYFSDENEKKTFRSFSLLDQKIKNSEKNLIILKNNTEDIIELVENKDGKKKKEYSFWDLIYND